MHGCARTILDQLGGRRFVAMTGAYSFTGGDASLSFRLPVNLTARRFLGARVVLDPSDTYTVFFLGRRGSIKAGNLRVVELERCEGIYCDGLAACFEAVTGLRTSL